MRGPVVSEPMALVAPTKPNPCLWLDFLRQSRALCHHPLRFCGSVRGALWPQNPNRRDPRRLLLICLKPSALGFRLFTLAAGDLSVFVSRI